jgi:hypothetical protein
VYGCSLTLTALLANELLGGAGQTALRICSLGALGGACYRTDWDACIEAVHGERVATERAGCVGRY